LQSAKADSLEKGYMNIEQSLVGSYDRTREREAQQIKHKRSAMLHAIGMVQTQEQKRGLPQTGVSHARRIVIALQACDCDYATIIGYGESQGVARSARLLIQRGVYQRGAYSERLGTPEVSYAGERIVEQTIEANGYRVTSYRKVADETRQEYHVTELRAGDDRASEERDKIAERKG
jgi:hypothetical protein